jgi:hypothetical protein
MMHPLAMIFPWLQDHYAASQQSTDIVMRRQAESDSVSIRRAGQSTIVECRRSTEASDDILRR